ncbi:ribonuclease H2 subunit A isoform X2 [Aplysia californica]|uniref:Ribonuclease n=1 Tax=Aplysia californica TaxID=6500 RepID=A0ABM0JF02_APLCA|nr:ribonuclease H2 subunit A isoform X2 [Aplysia californica]
MEQHSPMDQSKYEEDRSKNCVLESSICERLTTEPCWLGIDEAGRGPVLGPLVYGICFSPVVEKQKFGEMGFADSKTLTEEQRESIFAKMNDALDLLGWIVEVLSSAYISTSMLRREKYNLNALSHDCAIGLIQKALDRGVNVTEVYVDTVGDPGKYQAKLKEIFPNIEITVAKKADSLYPIVSAASICAKVARDQAVKSWVFKEDFAVEECDYGSGYPGDPKTKKFLQDSFDKVFGFPTFVRFSWSTAGNIIEKDGVGVQWEDDEEEEGAKGTPVLSHFFKKKDEKAELKRHRFFTHRHLKHVTAL